ncbi:MAG TPA: CYCXC family (seleno)protein [Terriglobales bacterium]|jgi:hypothetical protein|nr:CYCXC family (seleno)protein [Terriglobales bacterium]
MKRLFLLAVVALATVTTSAQWLDVPAYHSGSPKKTDQLPPILSGAQLTGRSFRHPFQVHGYKLAARIPSVIYQLPCYCYCDRGMLAHTSLRSCFESDHAASCAACLKEVFYAYQMHKRGKKTADIRQGIIRGEWEKIELRSAATSIN